MNHLHSFRFALGVTCTLWTAIVEFARALCAAIAEIVRELQELMTIGFGFVAQICNLLYRRFLIGKASGFPQRLTFSHGLHAESLRSSRLKICATAVAAPLLCATSSLC